MAVGALFPPPFFPFLDDDGTPIDLGTVEIYLAGTSTPQALYSDPALTISIGAVISLDAFGRMLDAYMPDVALKAIVKRQNGTTVRTRDNIRVAAPVAAQTLPEWMLILTW